VTQVTSSGNQRDWRSPDFRVSRRSRLKHREGPVAAGLDPIAASARRAGIESGMKRAWLCTIPLALIAGCTPQQRTPDQIQHETAKATREATQDAKAVAKGVMDGIRNQGPVDINKAPADDLKKLPGIDDEAARRIVGGRPYNDSSDLVRRHLITKDEYDRISDKVTAH